MLPIPCTISTLQYKRPSPCEPVCTPRLPTLSPLLYSTFPRTTFDFFLNPSPLTFLRHFLLLLMTSFSVTFSLYLLYPKALFTRVVGGIILVCISINGRTPIYRTPYLYRMFLAVFLDTHRTLLKLFSPLSSKCDCK